MKVRKRKIIGLLLFLVLVLSFTGVGIGYDLHLRNKYDLYYSYGKSDDPSHIPFHGVEIYCWKSKNGQWESGILYTSSFYKTPEQIEWLQDNLPCPLRAMRSILRSFSEAQRKNSVVFLVSNPPETAELTHDPDLVLKEKETYCMLYRALGLPTPTF